jgi:hypothetical protein
VSDSSSQRNGSAGDRRSSHDAGVRRRGGYGLRALGNSLTAVTKRAFARRGLTGADLARQWPAIVGRDLAAQCRPRQLRFPKAGPGGGGAVDGRLTLRVAPGWALEVQHLEPLMLERINGYFGYRAVARLRLQQAPIGRGAAARPAPTAEAARPLAPAEEAALHDQVASVADEELRAALERLGRAVRRDHRA